MLNDEDDWRFGDICSKCSLEKEYGYPLWTYFPLEKIKLCRECDNKLDDLWLPARKLLLESFMEMRGK